MDQNLMDFLHKEGYTNLRQLENKGICGISQSLFTFDLYYGLSASVWAGKYMFDSYNEALESLNNWTNTNTDPPGNWVKHKGETEYSNPNYIPTYL